MATKERCFAQGNLELIPYRGGRPVAAMVGAGR